MQWSIVQDTAEHMALTATHRSHAAQGAQAQHPFPGQVHSPAPHFPGLFANTNDIIQVQLEFQNEVSNTLISHEHWETRFWPAGP